jgi:hypothetical protein
MSSPNQLYKETRKEFRLRMILWIIQQNPGLTYEQIVALHNKIAKTAAAKESIVRDIKILAKRKHVSWEASETDGRMRYWYPTD